MGEIKKQGINNTIISYTGIGIGFVYTLILLPVFLTPEEVGLTRVLFSISTIFGVIFPFGLGSFTIKYFPQFRNEKNGHHGYLRLIILIGILSYLVFALLVYACKPYLLSKYNNAPLLVEYFSFVFPISLCIGFVSILGVYCISLFRSSVPAFLNEVYFRVANIVAITIYYFKWIDFDTFVIVYTLCFVSQLAFLFFYVTRIDKGIMHPIDRAHLKGLDMREMWSYVLLIAPASIASMALRQIDVTMLGSDLNKNFPLTDVAIYSIGFTIGSIIEAPFNALSKITDSKVSDAFHRNDMKLVTDVYYKSTRILMIIGGFLFLGVVVNIHSFLSFLPAKYEGSYQVVLIVAVSSFFNMATGINSSLIYYSDRYRHGSFLLFILIGVSILLNYILIPIYGIEGAAIATGSALLLFNLVKWALLWMRFKMQPYRAYALIVPVLIAVSLTADHYLPDMDNKYVDIVCRSSVVILIYGAGIIFLKLFPEANAFIRKYTGFNL